MLTARLVLVLAITVLMFAVLVGAFGAHALAPVLELNQSSEIFDTASRYHFYHGFALLVAGVMIRNEDSLDYKKLIVMCFLLGILLFSGSLYCLAIFDIHWLGAITPIGGGLFLFGWGFLGLATWNLKPKVGAIDHAEKKQA